MKLKRSPLIIGSMLRRNRSTSASRPGTGLQCLPISGSPVLAIEEKTDVVAAAILVAATAVFDDRIPGRFPARQSRQFLLEIFKGFEAFRPLVGPADPKEIVLRIDCRDACFFEDRASC